MTFEEYQVQCARTMNTSIEKDERLKWNALGIAGESGELVDVIKKVVYHDHELNKEKIESEIGDVLWYLAALADTIDSSLSVAAEKNIQKLTKRYPNGFTTQDSIKRVDVS